MLHQIELYRMIPHMKDIVNGFMDETRTNLADCERSNHSLKTKYRNRLAKAETLLDALRAVDRCLNE